MGYKTKVDWCDSSWNPVTGCCAEHHIPLFMKESLRELMDNDFQQEFPWEV